MRTLIFVPLCVLAAACSSDPPQPDNVAEIANAIATDADRAIDNLTVPDARSSAFPDAITISTNEPFWQARIEGDRIVLTGVDQKPREFAVSRTWVDDAGRHWSADAQGESIEAIVANRPCENSMSGAIFPFSGTIVMNGGRIAGCALPAGAPRPVPDQSEDVSEGANVIPADFRGRWSNNRAACDNPASSIMGLDIGATELRWHESIATPIRVESTSARRFRLTANYEGEGEKWQATQTFTLNADRSKLTINGPGDPVIRVRCEN